MPHDAHLPPPLWPPRPPPTLPGAPAPSSADGVVEAFLRRHGIDDGGREAGWVRWFWGGARCADVGRCVFHKCILKALFMM